MLKNNSIDINSPNMELYNSIVIGLQEKFVEIYDYIKNILEGKTGYIQNQWSKHGVKDGTRNVITSTSTVVTNLRDTNLVRPTDTIVGLHQYIASISPAAKREIVNFISNVFTGDNNKAYLYNIKTLKPELTEVSYKDINTWTSFEGLDKIIKKFGQDDIKTMPIKFNGKYLGLVRDDGNNVELYFQNRTKIPYFPHCLLYIPKESCRNDYPKNLYSLPASHKIPYNWYVYPYLNQTHFQ